MKRLLGTLIQGSLPPPQLKQAHALTVTGFPDLAPQLLKCACNSAAADYARQLFDALPQPVPGAADALVSCCSKLSRHADAAEAFFSAHRRHFPVEFFSFPAVFKACAQLGLSDAGRPLHCLAIKRGVSSSSFVQSALINFYSKTGDLGSARRVFSAIPVKDPVTYNSLISGYSKAGDVAAARRLFDEMAERTVVSWNSMISCYAHNGDPVEGLKLFERMLSEGGGAVVPTETTLVTALSICAKLGDLASGLKVMNLIKDHNLRRDLIVSTAILEMYVKCGAVDEARHEFDAMDRRDVVAWSAMIAGYAQNGRPEEALQLFQQMSSQNVQPNEVTLVSVLSACGQLGSVEAGEDIGNYVEARGLAAGVYVGSALVDMNAKCGNIQRARRIFDEMPEKDVVTWNSMIAGLAFNGLSAEALDMFRRMKDAAGVEPNEVTFVGLLTACTHGGLVEEGLAIFDSMKADHHVAPSVEHCACVVDLLCKSGRLEEAFDFVAEMEVEPNVVIWGTLLSACRLRGNVELAELCAKRLLVLEPDNSANYVVLSNLYAGAGRWADALTTRGAMKEKRVQKTAAYSWVEVDDSVHVFLVGDTSHPRSDEIYSVAHGLGLLIEVG